MSAVSLENKFKKITLIGPGSRNSDINNNTVSYEYDPVVLSYFSNIFMEQILNGCTEIDLSKDCRPEEFHAVNILLRDNPPNKDDYIAEAIDLLLKIKYKNF